MKILIVEDEPLVSWSIAQNLKKEGHATIIADDGKTALELIKKLHFDLVITDLDLPYASGFEIASVVKSLHLEIPVILITAYRGKILPNDHRIRYFDYIIDKPIDFTELRALIQSSVFQPSK